MGLEPNSLNLSSFSALTLLVGSRYDYNEYNVFGGTLNLVQSITDILGVHE